MADPIQTTHKVVEKLSVEGIEKVIQAFHILAGNVDEASKALKKTGDSADDVADSLKSAAKQGHDAEKALRDPPKKAQTAWQKMGSAVKKVFGDVKKDLVTSFTIGNLLAKAIEFGVRKLWEFGRAAWEINKVFEDAGDRIQGMVMSLGDFGNKDPLQRVKESQQVTNVLMAEFQDLAYETATPLQKIEEAHSRNAAVLLAMGKNQRDVLDLTSATARAAKVLQVDASTAADSVTRAIQRGNLRGNDPLSKALLSQVKITSKMSPEERLKKVQAALVKLGGPIDVVTQGTGDVLERWKILSDQILLKITKPVYEKIGVVVQSIVGWMRENQTAIDSVVDGAISLFDAVWQVGVGIWEVLAGTWEVVKAVSTIGASWDYVGSLLRGAFQVVSLIGTGIRILVEGVKVLADPSRGMGRLVAFSEAIDIKINSIAQSILKVVQAMAKMALPEWARRRIPGFDSFLAGMKSVEQGLADKNTVIAKRLAKREERLGLGPLTDETRAIMDVTRMTRAERDKILKDSNGLKIVQNFGDVYVKQDFRDTDPDRVLVEFVSKLERLGESALQSSAGGRVTALEGR